MLRALRAKNKLGFINGALRRPTVATDPLLDSWERCNDMVVSWIHNAISLPLRPSVAFVKDAYEVWIELQERFFQQNGSRIYELKKALSNSHKEEDYVSVYYDKLKTLWDELSVYDLVPTCTCGQLKVLTERYQLDCVINFLMGLNDSFSNVRDRIMLIDHLPLVKKVFSYIQQQKRQRQIVSNAPGLDFVALATRKSFGNFQIANKSPITGRRDKPYCTYCKITGHMFENCFKAGNA